MTQEILRNVRHTMSRLAATTAAAFTAVAICAWAGQYVLVRCERRAARVAQWSATAHVGAAILNSRSAEPGAAVPKDLFARWAWAVMADHSVAGAALFCGGKVIALQPADVADASVLGVAIANGDGSVSLGGAIGPVDLVAAEADGDQRLVLLVRPFTKEFAFLNPLDGLITKVVPFEILRVSAWLFVIVGAAVGGWSLHRRLWRTVGVPLGAMRRALPSEGKCCVEHLPVGRGDEFGRIARCVRDLVEERERSRLRAGRIERTMDAQVAARTKQIERMLRQAERRAWIDPLTKLGNRRLLDDRLEELFTTQRERGEDMSVIVLDVDNFKELNDSAGHGVGDELLAFVGELLRGSLRASDIGLRMGGDEFVVILLGTGIDEAVETADRLIKLFGQRASVYKTGRPIMMSGGAASIRLHEPDSGRDLLSTADQALYTAKGKGKGQVCVPPPVRKRLRSRVQ